MRIKVIGENDCARALRGLLRKAGFAVSDYLPAGVVLQMPSGGYVIYIEEQEDVRGQIHFDSVDCELEANVLRHVTRLSKKPVVVDRPGGQVHSDRELRILVPAGLLGQQLAVEFGVLRGLLDTVGNPSLVEKVKATPWWQKLFGKAEGRGQKSEV